MNKKQIFGCFSLRVSVMALAFGFFNLAWSIVMVNALDYKSRAAGFCLSVVATCLITVIWGLALYGAIRAVYKTVLVSTILWSMFVVLWLTTVLISCVDRSCALLVGHRGPESFWLMRNRYNRDEFAVNYEYYDREPRESYADAGAIPAEKPRSRRTADGRRPLVRTSDDTVYMKWTLITIGFAAFACPVLGSWYVLYQFCKEIDHVRTCGCSAVCDGKTEPA